MSQYAEMEIALTDQRKALNELEQLVKNLIGQKISSRPETTLALREVQKSSMALGKAKGALGITTPYTQSADPSNKIIENRSDVSLIVQPWPDDQDETIAVKMLRKDFAEWCNRIERNMDVLQDNRKWQLWAQQAYVHVSYATMWLGMVLNAIKTEQDAPKVEEVKRSTVTDFLNTINPFASGPANNDSSK